MVEQRSPLDAVMRHGRFGRHGVTPGVALSELKPGSIVQVTAWADRQSEVRNAIWKATDLELSSAPGHGIVARINSGFGVAPGKWLVVSEQKGLAKRLQEAVPSARGAVTDLSHGRTAIRISGPKVEWVLAKLFAIDFSISAFSLQAGMSTKHHEIFAAIQRTDTDAFDIYVFRSFAQSFWSNLEYACEEVGYEVC